MSNHCQRSKKRGSSIHHADCEQWPRPSRFGAPTWRPWRLPPPPFPVPPQQQLLNTPKYISTLMGTWLLQKIIPYGAGNRNKKQAQVCGLRSIFFSGKHVETCRTLTVSLAAGPTQAWETGHLQPQSRVLVG